MRRVDWPAAIWVIGYHVLALLAFVPWFFSWTGVVLAIVGDQQLSATDAALDAWLRAGIPFSTPPGTRYEYLQLRLRPARAHRHQSIRH